MKRRTRPTIIMRFKKLRDSMARRVKRPSKSPIDRTGSAGDIRGVTNYMAADTKNSSKSLDAEQHENSGVDATNHSKSGHCDQRTSVADDCGDGQRNGPRDEPTEGLAHDCKDNSKGDSRHASEYESNKVPATDSEGPVEQHADSPSEHTLGYQYQQLNRERHEIRVMIIEPSVSEDSPIIVQLVPLSLTDPEAPSFEALSYEWGEIPKFTKSIIISGAPVTITETLFAAMKRLRKPDAKRTLWADALCINQSSPEEIAYQIPLMGDIYSQAENVISWFGEPPSPEVDDWIVEVNAFVEVLEAFTVTYSGPTDWIVEGLTIQYIRECVEVLLWALDHLTNCRYWTRIWIAQEYILARSQPVLMYGPHVLHHMMPMIRYATFKDGDTEIMLYQILERRRAQLKRDPTIMYTSIEVNFHQVRALHLISERAPSPFMPISGLIYTLRFTNASKPRDAIYGIYAMLGKGRTLPPVNPTIDVCQLYWDIISIAVDTDLNFQWRLWSEFRLINPTAIDDRYPSWILDFHRPFRMQDFYAQIFNGPSQGFEESENFIRMEQFRSLSSDHRLLTLKGEIVGKINSTMHIDASLEKWDVYDRIRTFAVDEILRHDYSIVKIIAQRLKARSKSNSHRIGLSTWVLGMRYLAEICSRVPLWDIRLRSDAHAVWLPTIHSPEGQEEIIKAASMTPGFGVRVGNRFLRLKGGFSVFYTENGQFGEARGNVKPGDVVVSLLGIGVLQVLRPVPGGPQNMFRMVEQCWVDYCKPECFEEEFLIC